MATESVADRDVKNVSSNGFASPPASLLPWGAKKERQPFPSGIQIETDVKPGEFVLRVLFAEFTLQAQRKVSCVLAEPLERPVSKSLQRGEDPVFDQLLSALGSVAEHCLPSLLRTLFAWYERQTVENVDVQRLRADSKAKGEPEPKTERDFLHERRDLAVEFIFCLVLIEVLKQLPLHPGHEDLVSYIDTLAFKHFRFRESAQTGPNAQNVNIVADLYAEVVGVLAQSRFQAVRKRFTAELKELRAGEPSPHTTQSIISLLMGMKFFRIKMAPIEEFEASFQFMQECAAYFLEVKDRDVKHALAGLFVEILVPVAAAVKTEVNVPCLKNFVEMLYSQTLDLCTKKKHSLALFPLVTCLLCVSQKLFFLQNWHCFLAMCLSHLKHRDPKMCRVALESLYRLLWVYMIRIKCESNTATQTRLQSVVNSLFPKGSKGVVPRDTPLNIFVKIIQFVAQERLDFAMKEIVFDLLSVGRPVKIILMPERMNIGLRAFLVVADGLQQKEGCPPMPRSVGVLPSGNTLRVKKTFINKALTEDTAKSIGVSQYYYHVRKAFDDILKALDLQFGRPLMMTAVQNANKEPDDTITAEMKPKIDLFRTCVAAVPRLIPDGTRRRDLVDLLSRLTVHMDEELRGLAFQSLQNMMLDFPEWREDVIQGFVQFVLRDVGDTFPQLLDDALRMLLQFLTSWKNAANQGGTKREVSEIRIEQTTSVLHLVEGVALVALCNCRLPPRRLAAHILREIKAVAAAALPPRAEEPVVDVIDRACPAAVANCLPYLTPSERSALLSAPVVDLQWLAERSGPSWSAAAREGAAEGLVPDPSRMDAWGACLMTFVHRDRVLKCCPTAVTLSWPIVTSRIASLLSYVEPNPVNDNRASLLRAAPAKKVPSERDMYLGLWRNYLLYACRVAPSNSNITVRYLSPDLSFGPSPETVPSDRMEHRYTGISNSGIGASNLFKQVAPFLRSEHADARGAAALGLSHVNALALRDLLEELSLYVREAVDRKQENVRRRRRRDLLRLQLMKLMELVAELGTFAVATSVPDGDSDPLDAALLEFVDGARLFLEAENDRDVPEIVQEIKLHFCNFIHKLVKSFPPENRTRLLGHDLRRSLFYLFAAWSGNLGISFGGVERRLATDSPPSDLESAALRAASSVLCCGPCTDPPGLNEESVVYPWLDGLLGCDELRALAQETVVLLLDLNQDAGALLDWLVDRCYTGEVRLADGCFEALATVFGSREYPCDRYVAIVNVALLNADCPRAEIRELALRLLHVLDHRFFRSVPAVEDVEGAPPRVPPVFVDGYPCSWTQLLRHLARVHPELTMPVFSEITHRLQTARPAVRQSLLRCLLPWLHNMELVDPHVLARFGASECFEPDPAEAKEGWGSAEATEMVLNNLFYVAAKFGDEHPEEIQDLWVSLCGRRPNNLRVIVRYLFVVMGLAPDELLLFAKRVAVFLARARPEGLVDELTAEARTVETLNFSVERTETPPFFRLTSARKSSGARSDDEGGSSDGAPRGETQEKGTLHTKRRSTEDGSEDGSDSSGRGERRRGSADEDNFALLRRATEEAKPETPQPRPLPMPEYGGYYAPLSEFLPDGSQPAASFHRCNLAVLLLTDVVASGVQVDWTPHVPLLLHVVFLGLDHARPLVHEHCKRLLLNLLVVVAEHHDHFAVSRILLDNRTRRLGFGLSTPSPAGHDFTDPAERTASELLGTSEGPASVRAGDGAEGSIAEGVVLNLVDFLASRKHGPLWAYEDITAKVWSVKSAERLGTFLRHVLLAFRGSVPHVEERWARVALQLALSCSSRHYAGRSLQIYRALGVPTTSRTLVDVLSRLVETVAEQGEDMQGYVTELVLTLEEAVDMVDSPLKICDLMREIFRSAPGGNRRSVPPPASRGTPPTAHVRSTSYSVSGARETPEDLDARPDGGSGLRGDGLGRSRSALSLETADERFAREDKTTLLAQFFWIGVSLLDSDYEHEFLLALRLLERVLSKQPLEHADFLEKAENILRQMKWPNFPGVHALLLKGCTCPAAFDQTVAVLSSLTRHLDVALVDPSETLGFPFHVMALLPYLSLNYEEPTPLCTKIAESIARACMERSHKLENLATVMTLYSRRSFSKENSQWTKCVVKYLYDAYASVFVNLLPFLVETVERGSASLAQHALGVLYCALLYVDVQAAAPLINGDVLRSVARHVEGNQWKDALKILKHAVARSSTLAAPPPNVPSCATSNASADRVSIASGGSLAESEFSVRRELPGRTMEFTLDLSATPIVGTDPAETRGSPRRSLSRNHSFNENGSPGGWRRPWLSQGRTREHLVGLLTACGQRVGLPKSPSVVFSQTSDAQSSACSSTEEVSGANNDASAESKLEDTARGDPQFGIFKDFDFLEYELESQEGESVDNFNWGVRRRSPSNFEADGTGNVDSSPTTRYGGATPRGEESSDDEACSVSPLYDSSDLPGFPPVAPPSKGGFRAPGSPGSSRSFVSDGDLTLSNASPGFSPSTAPPLDDAEEIWRAVVRRLLSPAPHDGSAADVYPSLGRLLREAFRGVARTTRDACQLISGSDSARALGALFLSTVEALGAELPFVFVDPRVASAGERLRCQVLEVQEHWETFLEKREHVAEASDAVRSAAKLEALGDSISGDLIEEQKLDLCRALHRLHFQALLLLDGFRKMLDHLLASSAESRVPDLSEELGAVRAEVLRSVEDTESERLSPAPTMASPEAEAALAALLGARRWTEAARHLHLHRAVLPGLLPAEEEDPDALLGAYCHQLCRQHAGFVAVTRPERELQDVCRRLMDLSLQASSALHALEAPSREACALDAGNPLFQKSEW